MQHLWIPSKSKLKRLALLFVIPVLATAIVAPLSLNAQTSTDPEELDDATIDAILAAASRPVEAELDPTTTTTAAPTTTTTVAPTTTTTTEAPWAEGNRGDFALSPGAKLPTDKECAKRVKKSKETRGENKAANNAKATKPPLGPNWGSDPLAQKNMARVSGGFNGTTDEIIQWASCKWGFEPDTVRAQVTVESNWRQNATAAPTEDQALCAPGLTAPCQRAFGLLQIRTDYHPGTYPAIANNTAYNLDYSLAMKRTCFDGHLWLGEQTRGDAWGCMGVHYSGKWLDDDGKAYTEKVKNNYKTKPWLRY